MDSEDLSKMTRGKLYEKAKRIKPKNNHEKISKYKKPQLIDFITRVKTLPIEQLQTAKPKRGRKKKEVSESDKKPYCGIGKPKGNQKKGNVEECFDKGQIKRYGLKKVSKQQLKDLQSGKESLTAKIKQRGMLQRQIGKLRGRKNLLDRKIKSRTASSNEIEISKKEKADLIKKIKMLSEKYNKLNAEVMDLEEMEEKKMEMPKKEMPQKSESKIQEAKKLIQDTKETVKELDKSVKEGEDIIKKGDEAIQKAKQELQKISKVKLLSDYNKLKKDTDMIIQDMASQIRDQKKQMEKLDEKLSFLNLKKGGQMEDNKEVDPYIHAVDRWVSNESNKEKTINILKSIIKSPDIYHKRALDLAEDTLKYIEAGDKEAKKRIEDELLATEDFEILIGLKEDDNRFTKFTKEEEKEEDKKEPEKEETIIDILDDYNSEDEIETKNHLLRTLKNILNQNNITNEERKKAQSVLDYITKKDPKAKEYILNINFKLKDLSDIINLEEEQLPYEDMAEKPEQIKEEIKEKIMEEPTIPTTEELAEQKEEQLEEEVTQKDLVKANILLEKNIKPVQDQYPLDPKIPYNIYNNNMPFNYVEPRNEFIKNIKLIRRHIADLDYKMRLSNNPREYNRLSVEIEKLEAKMQNMINQSGLI